MGSGDAALFTCSFDRAHDALVVIGDPRPLHLDLELHLLSIGAAHDPFVRQLLADGLSALALWMVARPRFEAHGWTISIHEPRVNLFFTGSVRDRTVVGRAFHEHLASLGRSLFYSQTKRPSGNLQTSSVEVEGVDIFGMVEKYSQASDGVPVRYLAGPEGRTAFLTPFPDGDRGWIDAVRPEEVFALEREGTLKAISRSEVNFRCGCDAARITRVVYELYRTEPEELFRGEPAVEAECPRCGTQHEIRREAFDALRSAS